LDFNLTHSPDQAAEAPTPGGLPGEALARFLLNLVEELADNLADNEVEVLRLASGDFLQSRDSGATPGQNLGISLSQVTKKIEEKFEIGRISLDLYLFVIDEMLVALDLQAAFESGLLAGWNE
jgi:hypothetical protein